jgi:hypothetical protein
MKLGIRIMSIVAAAAVVVVVVAAAAEAEDSVVLMMLRKWDLQSKESISKIAPCLYPLCALWVQFRE